MDDVSHVKRGQEWRGDGMKRGNGNGNGCCTSPYCPAVDRRQLPLPLLLRFRFLISLSAWRFLLPFLYLFCACFSLCFCALLFWLYLCVHFVALRLIPSLRWPVWAACSVARAPTAVSSAHHPHPPPRPVPALLAPPAAVTRLCAPQSRTVSSNCSNRWRYLRVKNDL